MPPANRPAVETVASAVGGDLLVAGTVVVLVSVYLSAVVEYVLVDVLRTDEELPRLRRYAYDRADDGARLFLFRSAATASFAASAGAALLGDGYPVAAAFVVFAVVVSLVNGFTTDFVVPVVVVRGCSLREGWTVVSSLLRRRPRAFVGYACARVVVSLAVAVGATLAAVVVAAVYALPLAALSYALGLTSAGLGALATTAAGFVLLFVVAVVYVALVVASVALVVQLPIRLLVRSWSLHFLGAVDYEYALLERGESVGTYASDTYGD
ncbi:MAG: hypothetical protein ACLFR5_00360 [Halobacteriales archaeon]